MSDRPYVVALTGGIASGKTTVAERFAALGVPVFDADVAAREVVASGSDGLNAVIGAFGLDAMAVDGGLDRAWLRQHVFDDASARKLLEAIVHPRIKQQLKAKVDANKAPWVLLVIPLLAETWPDYAWVDRVLVIDVPESVQLQRLMQRDGVDERLARKMLAAQASREERLKLANETIDNTGSMEALDARVRELVELWEQAAASPQGSID